MENLLEKKFRGLKHESYDGYFMGHWNFLEQRKRRSRMVGTENQHEVREYETMVEGDAWSGVTHVK